jgi:hypothetical protein
MEKIEGPDSVDAKCKTQICWCGVFSVYIRRVDSGVRNEDIDAECRKSAGQESFHGGPGGIAGGIAAVKIWEFAD